ncbi:NAD-glutamate dehydrogenase domain-containing protein, partial [Pseudomonas oryzihabitans]|uniref:NAD-glutamate dehydrogenase domain-containing protein n=2 Tax=Pseudomonadales TaxID=72274 RepID=UPI001D20F8FB
AQDPLEVAATWFAAGDVLDLAWYQQQLNQLPVANAWQALAREAFRDEVDVQQRTITIAMLNLSEAPSDPEARLSLWLERHRSAVERWRGLLVDLRNASGQDYAMYSVASRELADLASSSA